MVIPFRKDLYRLYGSGGYPLLDFMTISTETPPEIGKTIKCYHPFDDKKRVHVTPARVEKLLRLVWDGANGPTQPMMSYEDVREFTILQLSNMREDHIRPLNPTPYKLSVSHELYTKVLTRIELRNLNFPVNFNPHAQFLPYKYTDA